MIVVPIIELKTDLEIMLDFIFHLHFAIKFQKVLRVIGTILFVENRRFCQRISGLIEVWIGGILLDGVVLSRGLVVGWDFVELLHWLVDGRLLDVRVLQLSVVEGYCFGEHRFFTISLDWIYWSLHKHWTTRLLLSFTLNEICSLMKSVSSDIFYQVRLVWRMYHLLPFQWFYLLYSRVLGWIFYLFPYLKPICFCSSFLCYHLTIIVELLFLLFILNFTRLKLGIFFVVSTVGQGLMGNDSFKWLFGRFIDGSWSVGYGFFRWEYVFVSGCKIIGEV